MFLSLRRYFVCPVGDLCGHYTKLYNRDGEVNIDIMTRNVECCNCYCLWVFKA